MRRTLAAAFSSVIVLASALLADAPPAGAAGAKSPLTVAISLPREVTNGVTTAPDGRIFMVLSHLDKSPGPQVVEYKQGGQTAFPDSTWNDWKMGDDPAMKFVRVNSVRIGPDDNLWIVDIGSPAPGKPNLANGPKVVVVDLKSDTVKHVYHLKAPSVHLMSFIDDIRFHGNRGYITDAGKVGAVIVMNLQTGAAYRALEEDKSVMDSHPLYAEHKKLVDPMGKDVKINGDQMEVSPDGKYYYYQACSGPLYRIATKYIDDPNIPDSVRVKNRHVFAKNRTTGGTAIDAAGNLYVSDTNDQRVYKITPTGKMTVLVHNPRLLWCDAMWVDDSGNLWMPAAQQNRMPTFNKGVKAIIYPCQVFKMQIAQKPPKTDHP